MEIKYQSSTPLSTTANLLAICVHSDAEQDALVKTLDAALGGALVSQMQTESFAGKAGQTLIHYPGEALPCGAVALIGAGKKKASAGAYRNVGAFAVKAAKKLGSEHLAVVLPPAAAKQADANAQMVTEGLVLGSYRFAKYLSDESTKEHPVKTVDVHSDRGAKKKKGAKTSPAKAMKAAIARGEIVAAATCHARDMVNEPAAAMNPASVVQIARGLAKKHASVSAKILGVKECEKLGMGMFLAVGRGSDREPKLVHLTYKPKRKAKKVITFVGKGVTFDSGGYSLKPSASMVDMKIDMAGCAAVVSAMDAIATLGSPHEVHVITACCENLISGNAYLLGDVLKSMDGTTVEINNTDAEGRLTLGDAITYAREKTEPDELFDVATLTGACLVGLGPYTAGVMSNNEALVKSWLKSCHTSGEDVWRLPLSHRLRGQLKSAIADMKNTGERWGGAITAGLFLKHFAKDSAWVHVDIAGPASVSREQGATMRGGTGFAVASLVEHATRS